MHQIRNKMYFTKMTLKVVLSIACYLLFTLYTMPIYNNIRAYAEEKMFSQKKAFVIGGTSLIVDVVDTPEEREKGLSNRELLKEHTGMFFVFDTSDLHGIWMKDMKFSIDIIWFNEKGVVIDFKENISPESYPTIFYPREESRYVLEVPAGFIKEHGIKMGDTIDLF